MGLSTHLGSPGASLATLPGMGPAKSLLGEVCACGPGRQGRPSVGGGCPGPPTSFHGLWQNSQIVALTAASGCLEVRFRKWKV